jgi:hypothetical protein
MSEKAEPRGLRVLDLLGVFYLDSDQLKVADEFEGTKNLQQAFSSLEGRKVRLLAYHAPPDPPAKDRWGAGSCLLEPSGRCPFGHHEDPNNLFQFDSTGVLFVSDCRVGVVQDTGAKVEVPEQFLIGHRARVLVMAFPDLDGVKAKVESLNPDNLESQDLDSLQENLKQVRNYLLDIQALKNNIDV